MGWMHDTLKFFQKEPVHRKWHLNDFTFGALYNWSEHFITVFSHDEVVHGKGSMLTKMPALEPRERAAHLRSLYGHMWAWPGKKLLFMGAEFGQSREWAYAEQLDWHLLQYLDHEGLRLLVRDLNRLHREEPVLGRHDLDASCFRWINCSDGDTTVITYLRQDRAARNFVSVVGNYTPVAREGYRMGVPRAGFWRELINTNSEYYGGTGLGNGGGVMAEPVPADGFEHSLRLVLPPTSTTLFKWSAEG
jgi:1,4-alpha-glucan branching enzyme